MQCAVIGAGLAGLTAASALQDTGHTVVVWEKSRGAGGRTATRRGPEGIRFDHGAPSLHDGDAPLSGLPALAEVELRFPDGSNRTEVVGEGAGNAPAKGLATGLDLRFGVRVGSVARDGARWQLTGESGDDLGTFDAVVVTAPAPQAADLVRECSPELARLAATVTFDPCWAVMAAWDEPLGLPFTAIGESDELRGAVAESAKPGRAAGERWVIQASASFSEAHLEADPAVVGPQLVERFAEIAGRPLPAPSHLSAHRWRYARPATPLAEPFLRDTTLVLAGDWCGGRSAGAAIRSGRAAAEALRSHPGVLRRSA